MHVTPRSHSVTCMQYMQYMGGTVPCVHVTPWLLYTQHTCRAHHAHAVHATSHMHATKYTQYTSQTPVHAAVQQYTHTYIACPVTQCDTYAVHAVHAVDTQYLPCVPAVPRSKSPPGQARVQRPKAGCQSPSCSGLLGPWPESRRPPLPAWPASLRSCLAGQSLTG